MSTEKLLLISPLQLMIETFGRVETINTCNLEIHSKIKGSNIERNEIDTGNVNFALIKLHLITQVSFIVLLGCLSYTSKRPPTSSNLTLDDAPPERVTEVTNRCS